jgi:hypothetical protein
MTLAEAKKLVGSQPRWALRNMVLALSLHPWGNTPEETARLKAAQLIIRRGP